MRNYIKLDSTALKDSKTNLPLILAQEEKDPDFDGVPLYGTLPLEEIFLAAFSLKAFENAEPTRHGFWGLKKIPYSQPMNFDITPEKKARGNMCPSDIKQGSNGNCWFLAAIGAILTKPKGDKFISGVARDLSQQFLINGKHISLGKLLGLTDDNAILIRWFKGSQPCYVLVEKSIIQGDFRSQSPIYIQMLEKAYIGSFLNGDFKNAKGGGSETLFNAFVGGEAGKTIPLYISEKRQNFIEQFSNLLNGQQIVSQDFLNDVFSYENNLITTFKWFRTEFLQHYPDSKKSLEPKLIIANIEKILESAESKTITSKQLELMINCLKEYASCLESDTTYYPIFVSRLESLFLNISQPIQEGSTSGSRHLPLAMISFDSKKIKTREYDSDGKLISSKGFIGNHAYFAVTLGKMKIKSSTGKTKEQTVIHLVNPWGHTGVIQVYSETTKTLMPVKSDNSILTVTVPDLIRWGKRIMYDPCFSVNQDSIECLSQAAMSYLKFSTTGLTETGLFGASIRKTDEPSTKELAPVTAPSLTRRWT